LPVIFTGRREFETWLTAPVGDALRLQRSFPNDRLKVVATGRKVDEVVDAVTFA
jgi:putative SOS response-associated peptidase YedK